LGYLHLHQLSDKATKRETPKTHINFWVYNTLRQILLEYTKIPGFFFM